MREKRGRMQLFSGSLPGAAAKGTSRPHRGELIVAQMLELGGVDGRIEFDQHFAGIDPLPIAHLNRPHNACFERLDDLRAPVEEVGPLEPRAGAHRSVELGRLP